MTTVTTKAFVHSAALEQGGYPQACPFNTARAGLTREKLESMGLLTGSDRSVVEPVALEDAALERFHTAGYLEALSAVDRDELTPGRALEAGLGTPDCPIFKGMSAYARLAAGATATAMRLILDGEAHIAFNPSGGFHHAMPDHAAGFCYLNDVVMAALDAVETGKRVLFLDIDVHHGDGVQHAFYGRSDVMTISMHESGKTLFPGTGFANETGVGDGLGYTVNIPLPVGTYDGVYLKAFREGVLPLIEAYSADVIIVELGMDALAGDPLAHLNLTNNTHADILGHLLDLGTPILATGGGGYHIDNTVRGWSLSWSVLCGDQEHHDDLMIGMGGVMLETTDWSGGLRDRMLLSDAGRRQDVAGEIERVIAAIRESVFPRHGL